MMRTIIVISVLLASLGATAPASAQALTYIEGYVKEANSGDNPPPMADVCVTLGPPTGCWSLGATD